MQVPFGPDGLLIGRYLGQTGGTNVSRLAAGLVKRKVPPIQDGTGVFETRLTEWPVIGLKCFVQLVTVY